MERLGLGEGGGERRTNMGSYVSTIYINHGLEVYNSDIPPAVEEVFGNIPRGPQAQGVYSHKLLNTSRWYSTDWTRFI